MPKAFSMCCAGADDCIAAALLAAAVRFGKTEQTQTEETSSSTFNGRQKSSDWPAFCPPSRGRGGGGDDYLRRGSRKGAGLRQQLCTTSSTVDAQNRSTTNQSTSTKPVSGSEDLVVITEKRPRCGVVIVAEGANDLTVQMELSRLRRLR